MTNVPDDIREMWSDVYKLFDNNYKMQNKIEEWNKFWSQAESISKKHIHQTRVMDMILIVAKMIEDRMKEEENPHHPCTLEDMDLF